MRKPKFVEVEEREFTDISTLRRLPHITLHVHLWGKESLSFIPIRVHYRSGEDFVVSLSVTDYLTAEQAKMHVQAYAYAVSLAETLNSKLRKGTLTPR